MVPDFFYINNHMTVPLEGFLREFDSYDDFEKHFSEEFLNEDARIGRYLGDLLYKYDKKASVVSFDAHLNHSYVGNIVNFKKNNPSRDAAATAGRRRTDCCFSTIRTEQRNLIP